MTKRFDGQRAIVTGGGGGFGEAICRRLATEGASVMVADIDVHAAERVAADLPDALAFDIDVTDESRHMDMAATAVDAWGSIDVVAANAGLPHRVAPVLEIDTAAFDSMWNVNVRSIWFAAKYCAPHMRDGGSIVATASIGGKRPRPGLAAYNASKAAAIMLTRALALELAPRLRVNCVAPVASPTGFVKTATGLDEMPAEAVDRTVAGIPMGRKATPDDVAAGVAYLASSDAAFLTGVALDIDGGRSIG